MWGQLAAGLFAEGTAGYSSAKGLFYGDEGQFVAQVSGALTAFVWAFGVSFVFFKVLGMILGSNRPSEQQELDGLDASPPVSSGCFCDVAKSAALDHLWSGQSA